MHTECYYFEGCLKYDNQGSSSECYVEEDFPDVPEPGDQVSGSLIIGSLNALYTNIATVGLEKF